MVISVQIKTRDFRDEDATVGYSRANQVVEAIVTSPGKEQQTFTLRCFSPNISALMAKVKELTRVRTLEDFCHWTLGEATLDNRVFEVVLKAVEGAVDALALAAKGISTRQLSEYAHYNAGFKVRIGKISQLVTLILPKFTGSEKEIGELSPCFVPFLPAKPEVLARLRPEQYVALTEEQCHLLSGDQIRSLTQPQLAGKLTDLQLNMLTPAQLPLIPEKRLAVLTSRELVAALPYSRLGSLVAGQSRFLSWKQYFVFTAFRAWNWFRSLEGFSHLRSPR